MPQTTQEELLLVEEEENSVQQNAGFIQSIKNFVRRQRDGANDVQGLSPLERGEIIRILRKSGDFRHEGEIERLRHLLRHIDFPARILVPGIHIEEEVGELLKKMFYRKVKAGSYVYNIGDHADEVYIVLSGTVDVEELAGKDQLCPGGSSRTIDTGHMFGEDAGMGEVCRRNGMAICVEDCHLAGLDRTSINRVYQKCVDEEGEAMQRRFEREATGHLNGFFSGWEFVKEQEGVRVYQKDHPTSDVKFFKGIGVVEKGHEEVADYILDMDNRKDWDPLFLGGQVCFEISASKCVRRDAFYTPSPLHYNRDFLTLYCQTRDSEAGEHYGISTTIKSVHVQESPDFVRADMFDTGFKITKDPRNEDHSQVTFITQVDPMGTYPSWLVDRVNLQQATYLINIRKAMGRVLTQPQTRTMLIDKGMIFTVTTTFSEQHLDLWCFSHKNLNEVMCMDRTRRTLRKIIPMPGDYLYSNTGKKMMSVLEDSNSEASEYMNSSYSSRSYIESGCEEVHQNCSDHLHELLMELGLSPPHIPLPWELFHSVSCEGTHYSCVPSNAPKGSRIRMRALSDLVIVVATCQNWQDTAAADESFINVSSSLTYHPPFKFGRRRA